MGIILQATLGGSAADFALLALTDRSGVQVFCLFEVVWLVFTSLSCVLSFVLLSKSSFISGAMGVQIGSVNGTCSAEKKRSTVSKKRVDKGSIYAPKNFSFADAVKSNVLTVSKA